MILSSFYYPHYFIMNTTIRYWFPDTQKCKYMSFSTYEQALKAIQLFKQIEVKSEVKLY